MADFSSLLGGVGGGAIGAAVVQLRLDTDNYQREMAASQGQTQAAANAMGGEVSKFSAVAKAGMLVAGAAVVGFAANSVKAASDQGEALNKSNVIFGDNAKQVEQSDRPIPPKRRPGRNRIAAPCV